ncbi:uncharacterized protein [Miscanthus floridulus]|uniref:uncharacterized protein n=1 Tax=Miscanthus floridulus TaxID=154761 RepID=UPI0034579340
MVMREVEALGKDLFLVGKVPGLPALLRLRLASPRFPMPAPPPPSPHSSSRARTAFLLTWSLDSTRWIRTCIWFTENDQHHGTTSTNQSQRSKGLRVTVQLEITCPDGYNLMGCIKEIPTLKGDNYTKWKKKINLSFILAEVDWVVT